VEEEGDEDDDISMAAAAGGGASFGRDVSSSRRSGSAWSKQSSFDWEAAKRDPGKWLKQKQRALFHALSNTVDSALHWQDQVSQVREGGQREEDKSRGRGRRGGARDTHATRESATTTGSA
jgi:hypothetical protein